MDLQTFGQSIKQKYPQYNSLSDVEVAQKVIAKYPQYNKQISQGATTAMESTGLYDIPGVGGLLRGSIQPTTQMFDIQSQKKPLVGVQTPVGPMGIQNPIPAKGEIPAEIGSAASAIGATDIPGLAGGAKNLIAGGAKIAGKGIGEVGNLLTTPSFGSAAGKATRAAESATKAGTKISWNDIMTDIKSQASKQLGDTQEVKDEVNKLISEKTPGQLENVKVGGVGTGKTPSELLDWRRQITARQGSGLFQKLFGGSNIESKVANVARNVISQNLHDYAPGTINPDKAYAFYSKIHGDSPTWAKRFIGGFIADKLLGGKLGGLPRDAVDAMGSLILGGGI